MKVVKNNTFVTRDLVVSDGTHLDVFDHFSDGGILVQLKGCFLIRVKNKDAETRFKDRFTEWVNGDENIFHLEDELSSMGIADWLPT